MMPDLGKYADAVLSAYAASIVLLIGIVVLSVWQSRRAKTALEEMEKRRNG
jgi:heme exporter protein D